MRTAYLSANERQIRESPNFREIWMFDDHESRLSAKHQKQEWGWINEKMFREKERRMLQG
jgi:hypothetical protein